MIQLKNICLEYGQQTLYDNLSLTLHAHDRIGLVGRNGSGKSTLLKVITGNLGIDSGNINISKQQTIAYMPQEVLLQSNKTVQEEAFATFQQLNALLEESALLDQKIHSTDHPVDEDVERFAHIQHEIQELGLEEKQRKVDTILKGLQFDEEKRKTPVTQLSVGWRMRLVLAKLLLQDADFYLFDEPTNHLDLATKEWFLQFLKYEAKFGFLIVCHDKYFLDKLCDKTFALQYGGKSKLYTGNYSEYKKQEEFDLAQLEKSYEEQQKEIKQKQRVIDRFRSKSSKAKMAQSMIKQLEKIDIIELEPSAKNINFSLQKVERSGKDVITIKNAQHTFKHKIFEHVSFTIHREEKVALVAPNGTGKTTLFNLIAGKLPLQHGSIEKGYNVTSTLFDQDQEKVLTPNNTLIEEIESACQASEQKIRSFLGSFLFPKDDVLKQTKVLSGGERNRVAMVKVLLSNANFLMLDEPTNHLDIESKEIVLKALQQFNGTILFVSHDQDFVNNLATRIIELTPHGAISYDGNYDTYLQFKKQETSHLQTHHKHQAVEIVNQETTNTNKKELYQLQKKCRNLETKIDKFQNELDKLHDTFYELEYGTEAYNKAAHKKTILEQKINDTTTEWEAAQEELDKIAS